MKKFIISLLLGSCVLGMEAQPAGGFGGFQMPQVKLETSKEWKDVNYAGDGQAFHTCDIYLPKKQQAAYPVVIHIYGSAWFSNNSKGAADLGTIVKALLDAGYAVVCPNHRSSADAKWPAQLHDIKAVVRFVRGEAAKYQFDTSFIATSGFSSGGHLASITGTTSGTKREKVGKVEIDLEGTVGNYTNQSSEVNAVCDWSGPIDLTAMDCGEHMTMGENSPEDVLLDSRLSKEPDKYLSLSASTYVDKNDPPVIIFHGEKDNVVPCCQGRKFLEVLKAAGVKTEATFVPEGGHGMGMYSDENLKKMTNFLKQAVWSTLEAGQPAVSPDGKTQVLVGEEGGRPFYQVTHAGNVFIEKSALGLKANFDDLTQGLKLTKAQARRVHETYDIKTTKQSHIDNTMTEVVYEFEKGNRHALDIIFRVGNNDIGYCYKVYPRRDTRVAVVEQEASAFNLPQGTTTFLCPQSKPMGGFARTSPSYETSYNLDEAMGKNGWGEGYSFPCLFKTPQGWVLISETGTDGGYVGCRLLNECDNQYRIGFPQQGEMNGVGTTTAGIVLPSQTPWRTITLGETLAPIAETTVANDLVKPKYAAKYDYTYGKGSWSWIIGQDRSCNFDEQKRYIDFSAAMGYRSVLIDAFWDGQIGYERMEELARYGREKGVGIFLWYNSNGSWNDAPQTPIGKMDKSAARRQEMAWMQKTGILGIKVDFFGGDKQPMMQLYEDILTDANDFGLQCIFHGCTLPRGWERMFPNYVASEAVLASENLHFGQGACDAEARNACIHPFIRNTVGSMDFGGSTLNKRYSADNQHGTTRRTSDVFALATAVLFQSSVQHFALAPNNLTDAPDWAIDFMKKVPTTWDEVKFIDGYPGKYCIMARRSGDKWYIAGINAEAEPLKKVITLPMFEKNAQLCLYSDDAQLSGSLGTTKLNKKQQVTITIPQNGGVVIMN